MATDGTTIFELLARKDQALLIRRNTFLIKIKNMTHHKRYESISFALNHIFYFDLKSTLFVLDFSLYVVNGVAGLDVQGDGFAGQSLHKDLHTSTEAKNKMKSGLFLDVVV